MQKIEGWDKVEVISTEGFDRIQAGGYVCVIRDVLEKVTKTTSRPMLVLDLDIVSGEYKDYYQKKYDSNKNENKHWGAKFYQLMDGTSLKFFKGLITAIERSNHGYDWEANDWNENTLVGKNIGVIFGEEEFEANDGTTKTSLKPLSVRTVATIEEGKFTVPVKKLLATNALKPVFTTSQNKSYNAPEDFSAVSDDTDDDLPF